jgi:hypothetical protein
METTPPRMNNRRFAESDTDFRKLCDKAGVPPTKRQASKFRQGRGKAKEAQRADPNPVP